MHVSVKWSLDKLSMDQNIALNPYNKTTEMRLRFIEVWKQDSAGDAKYTANDAENEQRPTRKQRGRTKILNSMKMLDMKDTQDNDIYIKMGKQWNYRLGTVSGEFHCWLKPGLRAPSHKLDPL